MEVAASIAGLVSLGLQVTGSLVDFYSAYKNQKSDVAYTAKKLERLLSMLETLKDELTSRTFRAEEQDVLKTVEGSIQDCEDFINELQSENLKFQKKSGGGIGAAALNARRRVEYPFRQSTLQKLDEDIDETLLHLSRALGVLQLKDVKGVQDDTEYTKALLDLVRADQVSSAIRKWLKAPDAAINYNEACKKRHPNTGLWLVEGSSFSAWLAQPNSFLWLKGFAGSGKSVLCSTAIQYAFRHQRSNPRIGIAFFFFTFNDFSKQDTSAMLRTLVLQLSCQLNDNHSLLSRLQDSYRNTTLPNQALMDCLRQLVRSFDDVYLILDALDESPRDKHRADVLQALADLREWSEPGLHLLVTSRDEPDIRNDLDALPEETLSMKNAFVDGDIAAFVSGHLRKNRRLRKWEQHHSRIEKVLAERAKGVFRWVECQFRALEFCPQSEDLLDRLLESLPQSLYETYDRMLSNIDSTCAEYTRRVLTLLCCAKRPLTVPELIDGVAVELGDDPKYSSKRRLQDVNAIHEVCLGFIEINVNPKNGRTTVRIAHFSVQEYLESPQRSDTAFSVRRPQAHAEIACICLTYLLEPALSASSEPEEEFSLAVYAAKHWHEHYHEGDNTLYRVELQALRLFRDAGGKLTNWVRIWDVDDYHGQRMTEEMPSPVYYASLLGLDSVLSKLLSEESFDRLDGGPILPNVSDLVNVRTGYHETALVAASDEGHETIVLLLLDKGANIEAEGHNGTALQAASSEGHEAIVRLLLERGADIQAQGGEFGTALQAASSEGYEAIVRLLLDKGANIEAEGHNGTALQAASSEGHEAIVRLLLERGADIQAQGGEFGTALQAAWDEDHEAIVQLLYDKGARLWDTYTYEEMVWTNDFFQSLGIADD